MFSAATTWAGVANKPAGFADDVDNDSGGDVTGVTAGTGLSGGGASGELLVIRVNNVPGLRVEPGDFNEHNVVGGSFLNVMGPGVFGGTIAGGGQTLAEGRNRITSYYGTVGGGAGNTAGNIATVSGGALNTASITGATVPGGASNLAGGRYSLAAGLRARVRDGALSGDFDGDEGAFVWADATDVDFQSTGPNQFLIRATNGVGINTNTPAPGGLTVGAPGKLTFGSNTRQMIDLWGGVYGIGVQGYVTYFRTDSADALNGFAWYKGGTHSDGAYNPGTGGTALMTLNQSGLVVNGTFVSSSDRHSKQDLRPVDLQALLDGVASLPISEWSYILDPEVRHVGPMAQDFRAAFGLGKDERHIATVDADGVALGAIQALLKIVEDQRTELAELKARVAALEAGAPSSAPAR